MLADCTFMLSVWSLVFNRQSLTVGSLSPPSSCEGLAICRDEKRNCELVEDGD